LVNKEWDKIITWRKEWERPYESTWSLFEKIKLVNHADSNDLLKLFNPLYKKGGRKYRNLFTLMGFDKEKIIESCAIDFGRIILEMEKLSQVVPSYLRPKGPMSVYHSHLNFCSICMEMKYHSYLQQFKLVTECPFHSIRLKNNCPECGKEIYFQCLTNNYPFTCFCGYSLSDTNKSPVWDNWQKEVFVVDQSVAELLKGLKENAATQTHSILIKIYRFIKSMILFTIFAYKEKRQ
jgi:hypothetical protein